jgi:hypothetical protein
MSLILTEVYFSPLSGEAESLKATVALAISSNAPPSILDEMATYFHHDSKLSFAGKVIRVTVDRSYFAGLAANRIGQKVQAIKDSLKELFKAHQRVHCQVVIAE